MKKVYLILCTALIASSSVAQNLTDSLLLHYFLDANAVDASGNAYHGTYAASGTTDRFGNANGASVFNGSTEYADLPNVAALKPQLPVTISMWAKVTDPTDGTKCVVFMTDFMQNDYHGVYVTLGGNGGTGDRVAVGVGDGSGGTGSANRRSKVSSSSLTPNTWTHVTVVVRGLTDMDIYIDCVDDGGTYTGSGGAIAYSSTPGTLGRGDAHVFNPAYYYDGSLDDLMYWNRALSSTEVSNLCNMAFVTDVSETDLAAGINIFPNPGSSELNIEILESAKYSIYNAEGKLIETDQMFEGLNTLDINDLPVGVYTIQFISDEKLATKKFVKN